MQNTYYMSYCDIGGRSISPAGSEENFRKTAPLLPPASPEVEPHLDQHQRDGSKTISPKSARSIHKLALRAAVKTAEKLYTRSRSEALRAAHHALSGQYGILTESKSGLHDIQMIQ